MATSPGRRPQDNFGLGLLPGDDPRSGRMVASPHAVHRIHERLPQVLSDAARAAYRQGVHTPTIVEMFRLLLAATPARPDRFAKVRGIDARGGRHLFVNGRAVFVAQQAEDFPEGRRLMVCTVLDRRAVAEPDAPGRSRPAPRRMDRLARRRLRELRAAD